MSRQSQRLSRVMSFGLRIWPSRQSPDHDFSHRHNEIELNYVERGAITYIYAGREIRIHSHESAVFWGAIPHQLVHYASLTIINIATVPLENVLKWGLPQGFLDSLLAGRVMRFAQDHLLAYHEAMYRQWEHDVDNGMSHVTLLEIRAFLHRCASLNETVDRQSITSSSSKIGLNEHVPHQAHLMARYITEYFQEPISVSDVAATVGLHPHYAMSIFKRVFDMTIIEYLTQQRIAYVQQHLLMTDASVSDIAYDAGFRTNSHFYSAFKRLCGLPPAKYRTALRRQI